MDRLSDWLTTTFQCVRHLADASYDLPAIPRWRRRRFQLHRTKYTRREQGSGEVEFIGTLPSIFHLLGREGRYRFIRTFDKLERYVPALPSADVALEFLEFYGLDLFSHWRLDRPREQLNQKIRCVDRSIEQLAGRCRDRGIGFVVLVDHGQELVRGRYDLRRRLARSGVDRDQYTFLMEVYCTRLWFHTDQARRAILGMLDSVPNVTVGDHRQMHEYNVCFDDTRFGEVYVFADHGHAFFPHDFYHPLANLFIGLRHREQRRRLFDPHHHGSHGHLPDHPSEDGFVVLADPDFRSRAERAELINVAPTLLALLGRDQPDHMHGRVIFGTGQDIPNE